MTPTVQMSKYRISPQLGINYGELVIDNFAGGGGASTGIEAALGRPVDIAINHDPDAVAMHEVNHPQTRHFCESVWDIDPVKACEGRPVGLAWFSPDCKHFSKAKGGKPVEKKIRGLAWVVLRWAATVKPRVIMLENVEEFITWGPLLTGKDGTCYPCPKNKGRTFRSFKNALRRQGYEVEHKELRASDYGTPTIRKRMFLIARCDGQPIVWPEPTHGDPKSEAVKSGRLKIWHTAAECIDWSIPAPSIFERTRPLAEATLRRIAKGIMRYVVNNPEPFIVTYYGSKGPDFRGQPLDEPLKTQTTENRHAVVVPSIIPIANYNGSNPAHSVNAPLRTITAWPRGGHFALCSAFLAKHYGGVVGQAANTPTGTVTTVDHHSLVTAHMIRPFGQSVGSSPSYPAGTITPGGLGKTGLVTSHLLKLRGTSRHGQPVDAPAPTITAGGLHIGEVRAFLIKYFGTDQDPNIREPLHTITTRDRFGLVTVKGEEYQIVDIGMRMLAPRELFRAQGFPEDYIIDRDAHGKAITKTAQVARCGNSVCPPMSEVLVRANMSEAVQQRRAA